MSATFFNMNDAYPQLFETCKTEGIPFTPQSAATKNGDGTFQQCVELRPYNFTITNPAATICTRSQRRLNLRFLCIETLGYIAGLREKWYMDLLCASNSQFEKFRAEDGGLEGAYGPLLAPGLADVYEALSRDPNSRQAVASIWSPGIKDKISSNTPCTCLLQFIKTGDNTLSLVVHMRSNDLDWGLPYDVPAFCTILRAMAASLGMTMGQYHHQAGSLHYYESHPPRVSFYDAFTSEMTLIPSFVMNRHWQAYVDACKQYLIDLGLYIEGGGKFTEFSNAVKTFTVLDTDGLDKMIRRGRV